ncbi:CehA/McbA family metallohydrolase [Paenibacillus hodogayensis]|uniref:CehA/McbA family metallohydrolase n=1 Tax=Paenibacillus hodogayensis TaxID=279208 RepID=A0ABV5VX82_9BACL
MKGRNMQVEQADSTVEFRIDRDCDWLVLRFDYSTRMSWAELRLKDPEGTLRYTYMDVHARRAAVLHKQPASTGYAGVPGRIGAGVWTLELIRFQPGQTFSFAVEFGDGELPEGAPEPALFNVSWTDGSERSAQGLAALHLYDWERCADERRRWYRGDLHAHTLWSDGLMTPEQMRDQAIARGLDFYSPTDHNMLHSSWPAGGPLVIPGMEFTSFEKGDWNALGLTAWLDCWGGADGGMRTAEGQRRLKREARELGALRSINHPTHGKWAWQTTETLLEQLDAIEIWNGPHENKASLALWSALWNDGWRVPGIGGSDTHDLPDRAGLDESLPPRLLGDPGTWVYADRLSARAVLDAVRSGSVYVSRGPELDIVIAGGENGFTFGADLTERIEPAEGSESALIPCTLTVSGAAGQNLYVIENGAEVSVLTVEQEQQRFELAFRWHRRHYGWRRFELRHADGTLSAVTNPLFSGAKQPTLTTWGELLEQAGFALPFP